MLRRGPLIAVLTGTVGRASKRSLIVRFTVSGQAPCSGAERRDKELDAVSTAIHGGAAAVNGALNRREKAVRLFHVRVQALVSS
jgi:hypothetical protein